MTRCAILPAVSRILSAIADIDVADAIAYTAAESARILREQGWQGDGESYDLGAYPGDLAALEELLDRDARFELRSTSEERTALEACIRAHLDATA